jgi:hypothetical protein
MEMECSAHQNYPVSKIQTCVALTLAVSSQPQVIMNVSVTKVSLEMELCVKVSLQPIQHCIVMHSNFQELGISQEVTLYVSYVYQGCAAEG